MSDRNENRPRYKKTKVGWIPEEWAAKQVRLFSNVVRGASPRPAGDPRFFDGDYLPWVTVADVTGNNTPYLKSTKIMLTKEGANFTRIFPPHTLILTNSGATLGVPKILEIQAGANDGIAGFLNLKIDLLYVYYLFQQRTEYFRNSLAPGMGQPNLNTEIIGSLVLPLASLPEQKKIAEIVSTWDKAIEQTHKLVHAKKQLKKGLMQQLLTGKKRLSVFSAPWKEYSLRELFDERSELSNGHLPLLAITGSRGVILASEIDRKDSSAADKSRYKRIVPGDVGYNTMRMWQGVSAISSMEGIVSPAYTVCIPKENIDSQFIGYYFKFPPIIYLFWRYSQGLVSDTLNLKFHNFSQIKIELPSLEEQQKIAEILLALDVEISSLDLKMIALEKQKRGLMQKLLTGEIRVKT